MKKYQKKFAFYRKIIYIYSIRRLDRRRYETKS